MRERERERKREKEKEREREEMERRYGMESERDRKQILTTYRFIDHNLAVQTRRRGTIWLSKEDRTCGHN